MQPGVTAQACPPQVNCMAAGDCHPLTDGVFFLICSKAILDTEAQTREESLSPHHPRYLSIHTGSSSPLSSLWDHFPDNPILG